MSVDFNAIQNLNSTQIKEMLALLEPRSLKYSPHTPTVKQQVFLNLTCKEAFFGGAAGGGKDIALTTPIATPDGWKTMEDIHPGDYVYGRDGNPTMVLAESEIFNHDCYEVTLDNQETIIAGATHVWSIVTANRAQRYHLTNTPHKAVGDHLQNITTLEMKQNLYTDQRCLTSRYRIPIGKPIIGNDNDLPIEPYVLGYWLGNGTTDDGIITTEDAQVVEQIAMIRDIHKAWKDSTIQYRVNALRPQLRDLGVLGHKHIPLIYLQSSYEDRLELLRGLMDSDGTIDNRGVLCFCNTNFELSLGVLHLLSTLGIKSGISVVKSTHTTYDWEYRNTFSTLERVFHIDRKAQRQKSTLKGEQNWFYIRSIEAVESVPTKCIKVAAADGLFRVGHSMVLTHNSDALLMDALQYADVKGYSAILFRHTFADLYKPGALIDRAKEWLLPFDNVVWKEKDRRFEFIEKYGRKTDIVSILQFGYLASEDDKYNYQGGEYNYIGMDELVHMSESNYRYLFSRLRRLKGVDIPLKIRSASNPPDESQGQWVYNRFVNPDTKEPGVIFIPAGMDDNPHLDAEEYRLALESLDPVTRARLRDGIWTIARKGNMFKREWFDIVEDLPHNRRTVRFWDMAATDPKAAARKSKSGEPDWTSGARVSEYRGTYYIEDFEHKQLGPGPMQDRQRELAQLDGRRTTILMEQEPGSSGIIATDHYKKNVFNGFNFVALKASGSKVDRANPISALAEKGRIKVWSKCRDIEAYFAEAESFPGGPHDDMVDSVSGAISYLMQHPVAVNAVPTSLDSDGGSYWTEDVYM